MGWVENGVRKIGWDMTVFFYWMELYSQAMMSHLRFVSCRSEEFYWRKCEGWQVTGRVKLNTGKNHNCPKRDGLKWFRKGRGRRKDLKERGNINGRHYNHSTEDRGPHAISQFNQRKNIRKMSRTQIGPVLEQSAKRQKQWDKVSKRFFYRRLELIGHKYRVW